MGQVERRLSALEAAVSDQRGADCEQLLRAARTGRLTSLASLSDQQLWWVATGRCEPMPADATEIERVLVAAASGL